MSDNAAAEILHGNFADELRSRYLTYAMSTIMSRALPDVRDGLKPVHRRVLYAMRMMKLDPEKGYKKCARVVGDVIGKYHPHGDQSVYDAMVRLSQDFALRYPLVDGQGNFGSIDGDGAAAMRYTEAKLTKVAAWIMQDLENGTVDFHDNYDESDTEPDVMPACFPNLLANGGSGIAVGLSTSIPPHNVGELCGAMTALLKNRETRDATLLNYVKGPDFPLGGVLVEKQESIANAYLTGRGAFRLRAKWEKEDLGKGQYQIIITEIPYQVQKSKLIEKIADLINAKKVPWLTDVMDESDENIRIVLEPKSRTVDAEALMETMFKLTDLESKISLNMNVLTSQGTPACLSLKDALLEFLDHRREVLIRKSTWRSEKINARLHILDAYRVVYLNIDEVVEIIKNNDQPAPIMMERFGIDEIQANAILDMRLRRLRKLEEMEIQREHDELSAELKGLQLILSSHDEQTRVLLEQVKMIKKEFADDRRTELADAPVAVAVSLEDQMDKEPVTILLSKQGWARAMKGHMAEDSVAKYKEGDEEFCRVHAYTNENVCVMGSGGKIFTLPVSRLPGARGFGEPVRLMVDLQPDEQIVSMFAPKHANYLICADNGYGFIAEVETIKSQTRAGKQLLNLAKGSKAMFCLPVVGDMVAAVSKGKRLLVFAVNEVPVMNRGKGVRMMNLKDTSLESMIVFSSSAGLGFTNDKTKDRVIKGEDLERWVGKRTQVGKLPPHGFTKEINFFAPEPKTAEVVEAKSVDELIDSASSSTGGTDLDALVQEATSANADDDMFDLFEGVDLTEEVDS